MSRDDHICAASDLAELEKVRNFVQSIANSYGFSDDDSMKIALAVDEACTNLIEYAFNMNKNHKFCVYIKKEKDSLLVEILDDGDPFNPLHVEKPDMNQYLREMKKGGLGIHLMRSVMDNVEYIPANSSHKQNILKLFKHF